MIKVDIKFTGIDAVQERLRACRPRMERAVVIALNRTAFDIRDALREEMRTAFDRPVSYTLNSLRVDPANPGRLHATIIPAEFAGKGTPARKFLGPEIFGGDRNAKRSEVALRATGILPADMFTVPGRGAALDSYGNQSLGEIRQILSFFNSAEMRTGYTANMTDRTRARLAKGSKKRGFGFSYFVVKTAKGYLAPGIYRRMNFASGHAIKPIMMFVKKPTYSRRYRWHEVAGAVARQRFEHNLARELAHNVK